MYIYIDDEHDGAGNVASDKKEYILNTIARSLLRVMLREQQKLLQMETL